MGVGAASAEQEFEDVRAELLIEEIELVRSRSISGSAQGSRNSRGMVTLRAACRIASHMTPPRRSPHGSADRPRRAGYLSDWPASSPSTRSARRHRSLAATPAHRSSAGRVPGCGVASWPTGRSGAGCPRPMVGSLAVRRHPRRSPCPRSGTRRAEGGRREVAAGRVPARVRAKVVDRVAVRVGPGRLVGHQDGQ